MTPPQIPEIREETELLPLYDDIEEAIEDDYENRLDFNLPDASSEC